MRETLLNRIFGSLTVIAFNGSRNYNRYWQCKCVCGNEVEKPTEQLTNIRCDRSCGCQGHKYHIALAQRFGKLTVVKKQKDIKNKTIWNCQCDCGQFNLVRTQDLIDGNTTSCGCNKPNYGNLTGMIFGKLLVINKAGKIGDKYCSWLCRCECGNICTPTTSSLIRKNKPQTSCGCNHEEYFKEYRIGKGFNPNIPLLPQRAAIRGKMQKLKPFERYTYTCQLCNVVFKQADLNIHHIIPLSDKKSTNTIEDNRDSNLICLCKKCHYVAHNCNWKSIDEAIQKVLLEIASK